MPTPGATTVDAGILAGNNASSFGSPATASITVAAGATLQLSATTATNYAMHALTLNGTGVNNLGIYRGRGQRRRQHV